MKELCLTLYQFLCTGGCFSGAIPHRSSGRSGAGDRHPDRSCGAAVLPGGPAERFRPGAGRAVRQERRACQPKPVRPVESGRGRHHDVVRGGSAPPRQPYLLTGGELPPDKERRSAVSTNALHCRPIGTCRAWLKPAQLLNVIV